MAESVKRIPARRVVGGSVVVLVTVLLAGFQVWGETALFPRSLWTGLLLLLLVIGLALFNGRKKLPFLPLLKASVWTQVHIYVGLVTLVLFLFHIKLRVPSGLLEWALAIFFLTVSLSGVVGLVLTRRLPKMMTRSGETLIYERIPRYRREIREAVREIVLQAEQAHQSSTIPDFYLQHVEPYLARGVNWFRPLRFQNRSQARLLYDELEARKRYFSEGEKELAEDLRDWIETKENLDFQEFCMGILRGWLFLHIPLSFSLILLGFVHGILVILHGASG